jgi:hypothetical protein
VLEIPNKGNLHDVFHVSCLKKTLGPTTPIQTKLPFLDEEGRLILKPEGNIKSQNQSPSFKKYQ